MGDNRARRLLRNVEGAAYWVAAAPVLARLPAASVTAWHAGAATGSSGARPGKRTEVARNLRRCSGTSSARRRRSR